MYTNYFWETVHANHSMHFPSSLELLSHANPLPATVSSLIKNNLLTVTDRSSVQESQL